MIRNTFRLVSLFSRSYKPPQSDTDIANILGYMRAPQQTSISFLDKLSTFSPSNMYHCFDEFTRELLFTFSNDFNMGVPAAIIVVSLFLKGVYFYPSLKGQMAALKMKEIEPYMNRYKQKTKIAQMTRNTALLRDAQRQFAEVRKKNGIDHFYNFVNLTQIPFLISWFLSLRYVASMPQIFTQLNEPFLWMDDICSYDPYFILPLTSAFLSSYSIIISPALQRNTAMPIFQPLLKYMKFLPFLSLPVTGFFPAALNIYWCVLAGSQVALMMASNSTLVKKQFGFYKQEKVSQVAKAVFVEEKSSKMNSSDNKVDPKVQLKPVASKSGQADETIQLVANRVKKTKKK